MATGKFNLPIASGGAEPQITGYTVNFYDIDGTLLKSEIVQEGGSATPPTGVCYDSSYLIFDGWNRSYTNITEHKFIGVSYKTLNNLTYIKTSSFSGTSFGIYITLNSATSLTINWGDGTNDTITGTGLISHDYTEISSKIISISSNGTYRFGGVISANTMIPSTVYRNYIIEVYGSTNITGSNNYNYYYLQNLKVLYHAGDIGYCPYSSWASNLTSLAIYIQSKNATGSFYSTTGASTIFENCTKLKGIIYSDAGTNKGHGYNTSIQRDLILPYNTYMYYLKITGSYLSSIYIYSSGSTSTYTLITASYIEFLMLNPNATTYNKLLSVGYLKNVYLNRETPPSITTTTLSGIYYDTKIFVPDNSVDTYKNATNWNSYANYIFPISQFNLSNMNNFIKHL